MGILARERGDALELGGLALHDLVEVVALTVELSLQAGELMLALVEALVAAVERLLTLHDAGLEGAQLALALLLLGLGRLLELEDLLLGLENGLLLGTLGIATCLGLDLFGAVVGLIQLGLGAREHGRALCPCHERRDDGTHDQADDARDDRCGVHVRLLR